MKNRFGEDKPVIVIGDCIRNADDQLDMKFDFSGEDGQRRIHPYPGEWHECSPEQDGGG